MLKIFIILFIFLTSSLFTKTSDFIKMGVSAYISNDMVKAVEYFNKAIELDNNNPEILARWALCQIDTGEYLMAFKALEEVLSKKPQFPEITERYNWLKTVVNAK